MTKKINVLDNIPRGLVNICVDQVGGEHAKDETLTDELKKHCGFIRRPEDRATKQSMVGKILVRWWYVMDDWPPPNYDYDTVLKNAGYRRVKIKDWMEEPVTDASGLKKAYELGQFPGVFRGPDQEFMDYRPYDVCPSYNNLIRKSEKVLKEMLIEAITNQIKDLDIVTEDDRIRKQELEHELKESQNIKIDSKIIIPASKKVIGKKEKEDKNPIISIEKLPAKQQPIPAETFEQINSEPLERVKQLMSQGIGRIRIARHLNLPNGTVDYMIKKWKRDSIKEALKRNKLEGKLPSQDGTARKRLKGATPKKGTDNNGFISSQGSSVNPVIRTDTLAHGIPMQGSVLSQMPNVPGQQSINFNQQFISSVPLGMGMQPMPSTINNGTPPMGSIPYNISSMGINGQPLFPQGSSGGIPNNNNNNNDEDESDEDDAPLG